MQIICCKWLIKFSFPLQLIIEFCTVPTLNNWSNIYLVFAADRRPYPSLVCGRHKRLCPSFLDVHYKQPWLCSTNHPPRTPQTVLFRWTLSSIMGPIVNVDTSPIFACMITSCLWGATINQVLLNGVLLGALHYALSSHISAFNSVTP
jgi:hypothetical protein